MKTCFLSLSLLISFPAFPVFAEESIELEFDELPDAVKKAVLERIEMEDIRKIEEKLSSNHLKYKVESTKTISPEEYIDTDLTLDTRGKVLHEEIFKTSGDLAPNLLDAVEPEENGDSGNTDKPQ